MNSQGQQTNNRKQVETKMPIFEVAGVTKHFGGIRALNNVAFTIYQDEITCLIGPNGAGKSTFINVTAGRYRPDQGQIFFEGKDLAGLSDHAVAHRGLSRTFQLEELFTSMSVIENVMIGCHVRNKCGILSAGFRLPSTRAQEKLVREEAFECLKVIGLEDRAGERVTQLPLGERKMLGVARALAMRPKLLMLDEPAGGLASHEVSKLTDMIYKLKEDGLAFMIVEHNMPFVMGISKQIVVLNYGTKIAEGPPEVVRENPEVIKAYLGGNLRPKEPATLT